LAIKDVEKQIQSHFNADGTLKPHQDLVHTLDGQKVGHDAITNIRETWEKLHPHSGVGASHVHGMSGMGYASDIHNHATSSPSEIAPIAGVHNPELIPGAPEAAPGEIPINPDNSPVPDSLHQGGDPYAPVPDTILTPDQLHQGGDNSLPSITPDQIGIDSAPVPDALTTSITPPDLHFLQQDLHSQFILADQHVTPGQESSSLDFDTRTHVDKAVEAYATHMLQTGDSQSTLTHISKVAKAVGLGDQGIFSLAYTDEQSALSDSGLRSFTTNPAAADLLLSRLDIVRTSVQNSYVVAA